MKRLFSNIIIGALLLGGAGIARADHALPRNEVAAGEQPQVFQVTQQNTAMRRAVHQARRTVGVFIHALLHPAAGQHDFEVKKPFRQGNEVEHIWLSDVWFSGNRFHGYVDNKPRKIKGLKMGQRVSVNPDEISDWAFIQNGRLVGGYTIRVLYAGLPADQKAALAREARFTIETPH